MFDPVHQQLQISVYQVARTPYQTLRAEIEHGHWAISHVCKGAVETMTRGERHFAPSGSVMVHPPGLPYAEYAEVPGTHEWVVFECAVHPGLDLFRFYPVAPVVRLTNPNDFTALFEPLLRAWEEPPTAFRDLRVTSLITQILGLLLQSGQGSGSPPRSQALTTNRDRFTGLIIHMSQHIHQKLGREDLAEFVSLQPNSLDRAFRAVYGIAPMQMLRDLRLQRAQHLLESTDKTVEVIAELCGFESGAYFSRVFHQQTGQTPGSHRRSVRAARQSYSSTENT
jgi:AraC-like DNA-binding protein